MTSANALHKICPGNVLAAVDPLSRFRGRKNEANCCHLGAFVAIMGNRAQPNARTGPPPDSANPQQLRWLRTRTAQPAARPVSAGCKRSDKREARGWVNAQRRELLRGNGGGELELATLPSGVPLENAIALLSRHPAVAFAEPNWIYTHQATSNDPYFLDGSLWGMYGVGTTPFANQYGSQATKAWAAGYTGSSSVMVCVIDEGIDFNHPDLAANIWTNPYDPPDGVDNDGNGYVDDIHGWTSSTTTTRSSMAAGSSVDAHGTHGPEQLVGSVATASESLVSMEC